MLSLFSKAKSTTSRNLFIVRVLSFVSLWVTSPVVAEFGSGDSYRLQNINAHVEAIYNKSADILEQLTHRIGNLLASINNTGNGDSATLTSILSSLNDIESALTALPSPDYSTIISAIQSANSSISGLGTDISGVSSAVSGLGNGKTLSDIVSAIESNAPTQSDYSSIISEISAVKNAILDYEGTDLQNVEAHQETIIDLLHGLLAYLVPEGGGGVDPSESSFAAQIDEGMQRNRRLSSIETEVINNGFTLTDIENNQDTLLELLRNWNTSALESSQNLQNSLHTIDQSLQDFVLDFQSKFPDDFGQRVIEETEGTRLLADTIDKNVQNIVANQAIHEKNLFANLYPQVQMLKYLGPIAHDTRAMRNWFQLYFGDGELGTAEHTNLVISVQTNELNSAISTNAPPDPTNATPKTLSIGYRPPLYASGINTNGIGGGGGSTGDKHGAFYDFVVGTNAIFRKYAQSLDLVATNSNHVLSNQLTQIFFQSNIWVAVNSITNMLGSNNVEALTMMVSNAFPWSYAILPRELAEGVVHPTGDSSNGNSPYTLPEMISYWFVPHYDDSGSFPFSAMFGDCNLRYYNPTNGLWLLTTHDASNYFLGNEGDECKFPYYPDVVENFGATTIFDYQTWLQASMRDSLALLSYGILDSITNSVEGQMEEFNSDDVETPSSDELTSFQNDGKEGIEGVEDILKTSLDSLTGSSNTSGEPEIVIDFASVPGMNDRIEVNLNQAAGDVKDSAHTLFAWLWRVFMLCYFIQLAAHEYDWWISLGKAQYAFKNGAS